MYRNIFTKKAALLGILFLSVAFIGFTPDTAMAGHESFGFNYSHGGRHSSWSVSYGYSAPHHYYAPAYYPSYTTQCSTTPSYYPYYQTQTTCTTYPTYYYPTYYYPTYYAPARCGW